MKKSMKKEKTTNNPILVMIAIYMAYLHPVIFLCILLFFKIGTFYKMGYDYKSFVFWKNLFKIYFYTINNFLNLKSLTIP